MIRKEIEISALKMHCNGFLNIKIRTFFKHINDITSYNGYFTFLLSPSILMQFLLKYDFYHIFLE